MVMAETPSNSNGGSTVVNVSEEERMYHDNHTPQVQRIDKQHSSFSVPFFQKLMAEMLGTYFLIFAGSASLVVNHKHKEIVTLPGIAIVWGLAVTVIIHSIHHVSGSHINPAVTIALATIKRFPVRQVPAYVIAQIVGATLADMTLRLMFDLNHDVCSGKHDIFIGALPSGSNLQAFVMEFIVTFFLMFVICAVATDNRAVGEFTGLAVGGTILLNAIISAPVSGASMNPARSLGAAIAFDCYKKLWIYLTATTLGAISGAWIYNTLRSTEKP